MTLHLYLIRHGETAWSFTGQHTGQSDIPLTPHGEDEARSLPKRLSGIAFQHVFTSPLQRAKRTCELAAIPTVTKIEPDLGEWNYGDYEGMNSSDIRKNRPGWNVFRDGCPNGESPVQVSDRADRLIVRLRRLNGDITLFSHGQFGGVLAARWIGSALAQGQHFPLGTASISILGYEDNHPEVSVIHRWNS